MKTSSKSGSLRVRKTQPSSNFEERIRIRAYELYEQRGSIDGYAEQDWLLAEAEILAGKKTAAT